MHGIKCLVLLILALQVFCKNDEKKDFAPNIDYGTFQLNVREKHIFVMFYLPGCATCKRLLPVWEEFAEKTNDRKIPNLLIAKVDCSITKDLCGEYYVTDYPMFMLFNFNKPDYIIFKADRNVESMTRFIDEQFNLGDFTPEPEIPKVPREVLELTSETFAKHLSDGKHFVKFYAPWCGHCQRLAPIWHELDDLLKEDPIIQISQVDCSVYRSICQDFDVKGYPTLLWIENGKKIEKYSGMRNVDDLEKYAKRKAATFHFEYPSSIEEMEGESSKVIELSANNFEEQIKSGVVFVKFFAPWCGHCKNLAPIWVDLAQKSTTDNVKIAEVDCTLAVNKQLCNDQEIEGYPSLYIYKNGKKLVEYIGNRGIDDLTEFLKGHSTHDEL